MIGRRSSNFVQPIRRHHLQPLSALFFSLYFSLFFVLLFFGYISFLILRRRDSNQSSSQSFLAAFVSGIFPSFFSPFLHCLASSLHLFISNSNLLPALYFLVHVTPFSPRSHTLTIDNVAPPTAAMFGPERPPHIGHEIVSLLRQPRYIIPLLTQSLILSRRTPSAISTRFSSSQSGNDDGLNRVSRHITQPKAQGASQAMLYATGLTESDMNLAQVGISSTWWSGNPCNMHLMELNNKVKEGVQRAGACCPE